MKKNKRGRGKGEKDRIFKLKPCQPYDSISTIVFMIPDKTSMCMSLRDSYLFVKAHVVEIDRFSKFLLIKPNDSMQARQKKKIEVSRSG